MGGRLDPAVAGTRVEVRRALSDVEPGGLAVVGCSGGADSLALLAATCFEAPRAGLRTAAVIVDHGLQRDSAEVADRARSQAQALGAEPVRVEKVVVGRAGGPEAAARTARLEALTRVADELGAACILLGHTRDDQAEAVLLGLARGSGARSLGGMAPVAGRIRRPLLALTRAQTRAACAALELSWWDDPHNADDGFARARVRHTLLPALEAGLGPGVRDALARTADLLRADADALDDLAQSLLARAVQGSDHPVLAVETLAAAPEALRHRVLRATALAAGCPAGDLTLGHVRAMDALVTDWRGQHGVDLPGRVRAARAGGSLRLARPAVSG